MPPELKAQRTVIFHRMDDIIHLSRPQDIQVELMREQTWAKVTEVYVFPKSPTIKVTFTTSEMARKAVTGGLLMFSISVAPHQITREVYTPLVTCNRCQEVETHETQDCPKPDDYKVCSLCASKEHTFKECNSDLRRCINCGKDHSARAMRCPVRKKALKEKEERIREARDSRATYATAVSATDSTPRQDNPFNLKGLICVFHAHMVECAQPGTFQATLSRSLAMNNLPDVKLPPNPPSKDIIMAVTGSESFGRASWFPHTNQQPGPGTHPAPRDMTPPTPAFPSRTQSPAGQPPPTRGATAKNTPEPETLSAPITAEPHRPDTGAPKNPTTSLRSPPPDNTNECEADKYREVLHVFVVKKDSDPWPKTNSAVRKGINSNRYVLGHDGSPADDETAIKWMTTTKENLPVHHCISVEDSVFDTLSPGPLPVNLRFARHKDFERGTSLSR